MIPPFEKREGWGIRLFSAVDFRAARDAVEIRDVALAPDEAGLPEAAPIPDAEAANEVATRVALRVPDEARCWVLERFLLAARYLRVVRSPWKPLPADRKSADEERFWFRFLHSVHFLREAARWPRWADEARRCCLDGAHYRQVPCRARQRGWLRPLRFH